MKKILSVCVALMLLLACIPLQASADGTPTFAVGNAEAAPGETVEIPVMIENNPGIIAMSVSVSFDTTVLTLQNAACASLLPEQEVTFGGSYNTDTFNILWVDAGTAIDMTESGTICTLTFLIDEEAAAGTTNISISYGASSVFNKDMTDVTFETRDGVVTIAPHEPGGWHFSEDCTLEIYTGPSEISYVTGMSIIYPVISDYVITTGGWTFEVELNENEMESTGAKLVIYDENGTPVEEYYSVLFGDINGDGVLDGTDTTLLMYAKGYILDEPWADFIITDEFPQSFAADTNHDLVLDGTDDTLIVLQIANMEDIDQVIV